ncbi:hypothetical protein GCK72_023155 [Caenorhabditis remanei]|uniref:Uncharacterized protein n=1 Tax=Caenorhabditis remanei TaxID=31234 RepID=A0A6A5FVQ4_CAERE|nr:hypothetical protein GCK72_023155 [Caenorhabditis remanei]KAF1746698.1 hypothetical protein GCK72_023155 [Caenorhabditis remanei]
MFSTVLLVCLSVIAVHGQNAYGNIYGYDTSNTGNSNSGLSLVQNPNYQFLNDQLANEYSQTYLDQLRNYEQQSGSSNSNGIVTSSSSVPANGYYTGPALSNQQQNQVNYQQIVQRNPSTTSNSGSSSNIYGYNYNSNSGSSGRTTGNNNYNNGVQYSAPSTAQPYIYPFGQFAPSGSSSSNPVLRDQSSNSFSSTVSPQTSSSATNNIGTGNVYTGRTYTMFDQPQNSQIGYTSASDLKTTRLRDQAPPATLNLRGTGPLPGPVLTSSNANSQLFRDAGSNDIYYGNANTNTNNNNGQATYRFSSRFFDVAGNNTEMYYPYRTSTNWQTGSYGTPSGVSGVQFDQSGSSTTMSPTARCALSDPYWCQEYVQIYLSSRQQYEGVSTQQACPSLIASLASSYNGCCSAVRAAGCSMS